MVQLVGILNITPDSFSDGGLFMSPAAALQQAAQLFADGAALVDIGAESTRPSATTLSTDEEWQRLMPVLQQLGQAYPGRLSLDTYHPETASKALELGNFIINDVTGLNNPAMLKVISDHQASCIISHLPGMDVQIAHHGRLINDMQTVTDNLTAKATQLESIGLSRQNIILDPGIGFGKTPELNHQLLRFAEQVPDYQVMIGYSRKRFLGEHRLELAPNLAAGRIAIDSGAAFLRVHNVAGHRQLLADILNG